MVKGVILVDYTDQGRRAIKDSPNRAEASKAEAAKLGVQVKDLFFTPADRMMLQLSSKRRARSLSISSCRASSR
jgi:GYD domain